MYLKIEKQYILRNTSADLAKWTRTIKYTFPYLRLRVCNDRVPSWYTACTSALIRSPSHKYCLIINSSSTVFLLCNVHIVTEVNYFMCKTRYFAHWIFLYFFSKLKILIVELLELCANNNNTLPVNDFNNWPLERISPVHLQED